MVILKMRPRWGRTPLFCCSCCSSAWSSCCCCFLIISWGKQVEEEEKEEEEKRGELGEEVATTLRDCALILALLLLMVLCRLGRREKAIVLRGRCRESSTRRHDAERTRQGRDRAAAIITASASPVSVWAERSGCEHKLWSQCRESLRMKQRQQQHGRPHTGISSFARYFLLFEGRESVFTLSQRFAFKSLFPTLGCPSERKSMYLLTQYLFGSVS